MTPEQAWTIAGAVLTSLAGGGAIVLALSSWLARSWARRMLEEDRARYHAELDAVKHTYTHELERLKDDLEASNRKLHSHLDHAVLVSRPQFEAEFRTLTNTWERIADLRAVFPVLDERPNNRTRANDTEYATWCAKVRAEFVPRADALMNSVTAQAPFYPKELLEALSDQIQIAKTALSEAITDNPRESPDYVRRRRELHQNFETGASRLLDMIRDRLAHLTIVQETVPA
jgi:hypothetical protein